MPVAARPAAPLGLPRGRHDADRPGPARERRRARRARGRRGGIGLRPARAADARDAREARGDGARASPRASAWRWPGTAPASPAPARSSWRRSPSLELTDDGRIRILTASTEMGQGTKTIFPQLVADSAGRRVRRGRDRAAGHLDRARLRPDRRLPHRHGRRGLLIKAAERLRAQVEEETGRPLRRRRIARRGPTPRSTSSSTPYPGVTFDDKTYTGDAYPAFGWAAAVAGSRWTSTPAR